MTIAIPLAIATLIVVATRKRKRHRSELPQAKVVVRS